MTDKELIVYEQDLSDELINSSHSGRNDVNVGIGLGSWGGAVGYGVRADRLLGSNGNQATTLELKMRREEVREEMRRRGLLPK